MTDTHLFFQQNEVGTDNQAIALSINSGGSLFWVDSQSRTWEVDEIAAELAASDSVTTIAITITPGGGTPMVQVANGKVIEGTAVSSLAWSYATNGRLSLDVGVPAAATGQNNTVEWKLDSGGSPPVKLKVTVKRLAIPSMGPFARSVPVQARMRARSPDVDDGSIVVTHVVIGKKASTESIAAIMSSLDERKDD